MIVNAYRFFEEQKAEGLFKGTRTRELVGTCLDCHPNTVDSVMRAEREAPGTNFETKDSNRGRERDYDLTEIEPVIRLFIESENKLARPTTAVRISNHLRDMTQISLSERTMQRVLGELNFHHIKGERRHIYAESEANIAFRTSYLRKKVANRVGTAVSRPEVYLDESFCNVNHVVSKTWLTSEKIRYGKSGKGDR
ncbi:hypothetical protein ON010_g16180 [Phytophthora cinnamomi]|nr:hypothetical protein ON010_g16180 [Phytophthora cinnamomi]